MEETKSNGHGYQLFASVVIGTHTKLLCANHGLRPVLRHVRGGLFQLNCGCRRELKPSRDFFTLETYRNRMHQDGTQRL